MTSKPTSSDIYDINRKPRIVCYIKDFIQSEEEKPYDVESSIII